MTVSEMLQIALFALSALNTSILIVYFVWNNGDRKVKKLFNEFKHELSEERAFVTAEQCQASSLLMDKKLDSVSDGVGKIDRKTSEIWKVMDAFRERLSKIEGYLQKNT